MNAIVSFCHHVTGQKGHKSEYGRVINPNNLQSSSISQIEQELLQQIFLYFHLHILERFSIAFTANGKRQAEISRLPKTREIYLVSAYILPDSHSYGASTKNREIS